MDIKEIIGRLNNIKTAGYVVAGDEYYCRGIDAATGCLSYLKKYEDTNLTPREIEQLKAEIQEYKDKLADGRMIELPCKIGDTLYEILPKRKYAPINTFVVPDVHWIIDNEEYFGKTIFFTLTVV